MRASLAAARTASLEGRMRAVFVNDFERPFSITECPDPPPPGPEEVVIDIHTSPVSFAATLIASGKYQYRPELPFIPGSECSGVVRQIGSAVRGLKVGDRVAALGARRSGFDELRLPGTFVTASTFDVECVMRVPDSMTLENAAMLRANYETAMYGLDRGQLKAGEVLLVLGAGGGTGFAAVTIGAALGARVIGSASTKERRALARRAGADFVLDMRADDWREQIKSFTGGRGVDCVFDPVGGDATERAFRSLAFGGRHVVIGFAAGRIPSLPVNLPLMKAASLIGANLLRALREDPELALETRRRVWELLDAGRLALPVVARRYTLEETAEAFRAVANAEGAGRIVVSVNPDLDRAGAADVAAAGASLERTPGQ